MPDHHPIILPFLLLVLNATVQAQAPPDSGTRVRITSPEVPQGTTVGVLERFAGDTLVVAGQRISRASISRFEVIAGRKSRAVAGMGIGFVLGAGIGALSGALGCPQGDEGDWRALCAFFGGGIGGGVGLLVGGIVGSTKHREQWRTVSLSTLRIAPMLRSDGTFGVSMGLRF